TIPSRHKKPASPGASEKLLSSVKPDSVRAIRADSTTWYGVGDWSNQPHKESKSLGSAVISRTYRKSPTIRG
ncbi:MAG: hypothetical protein ACKOFD_08660, partial [Actinomycetota bacterium]